MTNRSQKAKRAMKGLRNFFYARSALNWILNEDWFLLSTRNGNNKMENGQKARTDAKATCQETK